jgi:hypothetical protein
MRNSGTKLASRSDKIPRPKIRIYLIPSLDESCSKRRRKKKLDEEDHITRGTTEISISDNETGRPKNSKEGFGLSAMQECVGTALSGCFYDFIK